MTDLLSSSHASFLVGPLDIHRRLQILQLFGRKSGKMARGGRGAMPPFGGKGGMGMGLPMELPQGLNPELLAQMLGGGIPGKGSMAFPVVEEREEDDGVDRSRWQVLYPAYLNKKYTTAKGRRVNQAIAVEDPTVQEMKMICDHFAVPAHIEIVSHQ